MVISEIKNKIQVIAGFLNFNHGGMEVMEKHGVFPYAGPCSPCVRGKLIRTSKPANPNALLKLLALPQQNKLY